ncbi:hypothetical protein L228DRAFT_239065 [Xylona heveae TC161]|uniref:DUF6604 domain-containing protein n=1 Tax=Xylona heveae (strain CBS 132557 / TC161) TaxID=1328760 RepID=A0A165GD05_XYLHT|nr:hypothetical protein L228DRAFT_239065 [Xylona heveae TC161]KZF22043.1 hypothetical protein L228DRAFT_239065 [Xylona heveae TC161]
MLTAYLTSSYLQYKTDTNVVASWLATTAKKLGCTVDLLVKSPEGEQKHQQKQPTGRLKGRVRKAAPEASHPPETERSSPSSKAPARLIAIQDFVRLAEYIANHNSPAVTVPEYFVRSITRAIAVRRSHGELVFHKDKRSDQKHTFFISILERVSDILRSQIPSDLKQPPSSPTADASSTNAFDVLGVQEPSRQFLQAPNVSPTPVQQLPDLNYEAERFDDAEEAFLAFTLLLTDYSNLRSVISQTWEGYRQGLYFLDLCSRLGEDQDTKEYPDDEMNFRIYESSQTFMLPTYQILRGFIDMLEPDYLPEYKPGFCGKYDPVSDRSKKTAREKFREDKILLMEILPEFCMICLGLVGDVTEDGLTRGLRTAFKTKKISLSLLLSTQVYLDIHHILRDGVSRGFDDLQKVGRVIGKSIELTLKFHESLRIMNWPRSNDKAFEGLQLQIHDWVKNDAMMEAKRRVGRLSGDAFQLLRSHPLFCGLYAYNLKARYQEISIVFVNAWGSILYTCHLYNAAQQEKLLQKEWKDMEMFMHLHRNVFVGSKPDNPEDYLRRFSLSMGYSATAFAKSKRSRELQASKRGPKCIEELAPVAQMFKGRYCYDLGQMDLTKDDLEKIVSKSKWKQDEISEGVYQLSLDETAKENRATTTPQRQLTLTELLEHLRNALVGETLELNFDHLFLHRLCWTLLRSINESCREQLQAIYGSGYLGVESQLPFIVGYIFMAATNTKKLGELLVHKKSDVVTSKLLVAAAARMDGYIAQIGTAVIKFMELGYRMRVVDESQSESNEVIAS